MSDSPHCQHRQRVALAGGETLVLDDARGVVIDATSGLLWVTVSGEAGDIFLSPGQSYCVMGRGRVVIEGSANALNELRLHCPSAFLADRVRPFLDRSLACICATMRRERKATAG